MSNLLDGVDTYNLPSLSLARSYQSHEPIVDNRPLQFSITGCGKLLIVGSDRGSVSVYERSSGKYLRSLKHGDGLVHFPQCEIAFNLPLLQGNTLVQAVAVSRHYIVVSLLNEQAPADLQQGLERRHHRQRLFN